MTPYSARIRHVVLIEREKNNVQTLKVYRDDNQVVPTAASYTLKTPDDTVLVDDASASIGVDGTITYTVNSSLLGATRELGEGYVEEFKVTISSNDIVFRRMASLVLRKLYPVISDADLTQT